MEIPVDDLPFVSVIVPCRNEKGFVAACLDSLAANDYPKTRMEILVVDGMSEDGTREVLAECARRFPFVKILDNPKKVTPAAFNIGVRNARGDLIMIMSSHATCGADTISQCVTHSRQSGAENVGGIWKIKPGDRGLIASCICTALSHRFGVGGAAYRTLGKRDREPRWVDTAAYGCYRKEVFSKIGLFNEKLVRGQDIELNLRLKRAGGRTLLVPSIVINYYARTDLGAFWMHQFKNGVWAILPFLYSPIMPVRWRHLVPLAFVLGLLGSVVVATVHPAGLWVLAGIAGTYAIGNVTASLQVSLREKDIRYLVAMPVVFASLHVAYGVGSLWGLVKVFVCTVFKSRRAYQQGEVKRPC